MSPARTAGNPGSVAATRTGPGSTARASLATWSPSRGEPTDPDGRRPRPGAVGERRDRGRGRSEEDPQHQQRAPIPPAVRAARARRPAGPAPCRGCPRPSTRPEARRPAPRRAPGPPGVPARPRPPPGPPPPRARRCVAAGRVPRSRSDADERSELLQRRRPDHLPREQLVDRGEWLLLAGGDDLRDRRGTDAGQRVQGLGVGVLRSTSPPPGRRATARRRRLRPRAPAGARAGGIASPRAGTRTFSPSRTTAARLSCRSTCAASAVPP